MPISEKLAQEFLTIIGFHLPPIIILLGLSTYIYLKSKKNATLFTFILLVSSFEIWMISKIFKTVAPNITLRWFFIVTQYIGINLLGFALIAFAFAYSQNRYLSKKTLIALSIAPLISTIIMATNPWHNLFYSYFDFYKDRFGPIFYPTQAVQYVYWLVGIWLLARGFKNQPAFRGRRAWANFFSTVTLIPLFANLYYILFKLNLLPWIFPFRVFDITPIFGSIALILFIIPGLRYRFFDLSPYTYSTLYQQIQQGLAVFYEGQLILTNPYIDSFLNAADISRLYHKISTLPPGTVLKEDIHSHQFHLQLLTLDKPKAYLSNKPQQYQILWVHDHTNEYLLIAEQEEKTASLNLARQAILALKEKSEVLSNYRAKAQIAQNVHDILGHSLTLAISTAEIAATYTEVPAQKEKLTQIEYILNQGLSELRSTFFDQNIQWQNTVLINALENLKHGAIEVEITYQGVQKELPPASTQAIYRLCQEAITNALKHGHAKRIDIIIRYSSECVMVFAIDNGKGCSHISENMGLGGIRKRLLALGGEFQVFSNDELGFTLKATIPYTS